MKKSELLWLKTFEKFKSDKLSGVFKWLNPNLKMEFKRLLREVCDHYDIPLSEVDDKNFKYLSVIESVDIVGEGIVKFWIKEDLIDISDCNYITMGYNKFSDSPNGIYYLSKDEPPNFDNSESWIKLYRIGEYIALSEPLNSFSDIEITNLNEEEMEEIIDTGLFDPENLFLYRISSRIFNLYYLFKGELKNVKWNYRNEIDYNFYNNRFDFCIIFDTKNLNLKKLSDIRDYRSNIAPEVLTDEEIRSTNLNRYLYQIFSKKDSPKDFKNLLVSLLKGEYLISLRYYVISDISRLINTLDSFFKDDNFREYNIDKLKDLWSSSKKDPLSYDRYNTIYNKYHDINVKLSLELLEKIKMLDIENMDDIYLVLSKLESLHNFIDSRFKSVYDLEYEKRLKNFIDKL
jgi:hypothetical protein